MVNDVFHEPVLLNEAIEALNVKKNGKYIDCTLGAGGHAEGILKNGGKVLGIEADETMVKLSEERLAKSCPTLVRGNFGNIVEIARTHNFAPVDGVLMDLGISNFHYKSLKRGFSYKNVDEPLDMRLSEKDLAVTGATLLNVLSEKQLVSLFEGIIGVQKTRQIVRRIIRAREGKAFETVSDLQKIARDMSPEVFLALRVFVNNEFDILEKGIRGAFELLGKGGKLVVISFHSLEDKIVVRLFREFEKNQKGKTDSPKPTVPEESEIERNPKSRSALMRSIEKI